MVEEVIIGHLAEYYDLKADVRYSRAHVPIRQLVNPNDPDVQKIAELCHRENDFVDACQYFVNTYVRYQNEEGDYWGTPQETLANRFGDCDDMAILLCSLLRNYIPPERVFCAVAVWGVESKAGGHMMVVLQDEDGTERILEATADPDKPLIGRYEYYAIFNDKYAFATKAGLQVFGLLPVA